MRGPEIVLPLNCPECSQKNNLLDFQNDRYIVFFCPPEREREKERARERERKRKIKRERKKCGRLYF